MKVSVIIPCYNAAPFILESVNSILRQTYLSLEVIICDDNSTDNSYNILRGLTDTRIILLKNDENMGYLKTINKLFSFASGELIAFQDADDVSDPTRISKQVEAICENNWDLLGTNYQIINEIGQPVSPIIRTLEEPQKIKEELIKRNLFQKPSILFRNEILDKVGGYREDFLQLKNISEDYDWLLRINEAGFEMGNINDEAPLYLYRSVSTAMTKGFNQIEQLFGERLAQHLASQRRKGITDDLANKNFTALLQLIEKWKIPYINNPGLFYIERASHLMYFGLNKQAIKFSWQACIKSGFSIKSLRTLVYCVRKTYTKF